MLSYFDPLIVWLPAVFSIMSYKQPNYQQPPTTNTADAEAARQRNAAAASADATDHGRASTAAGGTQIAYAKQQGEQRDLMKTKRASADLGVS